MAPARKGSPFSAGVQVPYQLSEFERAIGAIDHAQGQWRSRMPRTGVTNAVRSLSLTRRHFCLPLPLFLDHVDFRQR